jgi:hypothetical protein
VFPECSALVHLPKKEKQPMAGAGSCQRGHGGPACGPSACVCRSAALTEPEFKLWERVPAARRPGSKVLALQVLVLTLSFPPLIRLL